MQVQQINNNSTSFGKFYKDANLPQHIFDRLLETPPVKKFGEKYNATLAVDAFFSSRDNKTIQYKLKVTDIEKRPRNFLDKILMFIKPEKTNHIELKTHAISEEGVLDSISRKKSSALLELMEKKD